VLGDPSMAFRSISTRSTLPRLENLETRRSKHLSLQTQKGGKKPRKPSRCISNDRNLKHIVAQSPVTHGPGTPSMYLPKAATSSRGSFFKRRPPRPLQRRQPITKDSRIKPWPHLCPKAAKSGQAESPLIVRRRRARNKLYPRTLQVDVHSTVLYRPNCGEASVYVRFPTRWRRQRVSWKREAILHAVQVHVFRSSSR
jgi:hypothetical protein